MRHFAIALLGLSLLPISIAAQNLPDAPAPAPDPEWSRLQSLAAGRPIVVTDVENRSVHCLFAGVTEEHLFCNPAGNPPGVGFRFDRAQVLSVDLDRADAPQARVGARERNYHPGWISCMIAGGILVGLGSRDAGAGRATENGLIAAGIVGVIGAPIAFLPHRAMAQPGTAHAPMYMIGARFELPGRSRIRR